MYRHEEVIEALFGRVGFRQPTLAEYADIFDEDNTESRSGLYFDDFHSIVTVQALRDVVINDPKVEIEDFNTYVSELSKSCILKVLDGVFGVPDIIEQQQEFEPCDNQPTLIEKAGRFVGRQIRVSSNGSCSVVIESAVLLFDSAATFKIYLFDSLKKVPLKELEVTTSADEAKEVLFDNWALNRAGIYYLGYFENDLGSVKAYDIQYYRHNCGRVYGSSCFDANVTADDFVRFNPRIGSQTFGLNVRFSSVKDFTETIVRNQATFDRAVGLQMAAVVVEKIMNSLRSNGNQRITEAQASRLYNDLNVEMPTQELPVSYGLKKQLRRELDRLKDIYFPKPKAQVNQIPTQCYTPRFRR